MNDDNFLMRCGRRLELMLLIGHRNRVDESASKAREDHFSSSSDGAKKKAKHNP